MQNRSHIDRNCLGKLSCENAHRKIIPIDNIGMSKRIYGHIDLTYVGDLFKKGPHNILGPASFGLPIILGPHHTKFPEAKLFIENGIGFSISSADEFETALKKLQTDNLKEKVIGFMNSQKGATELIRSHTEIQFK